MIRPSSHFAAALTAVVLTIATFQHAISVPVAATPVMAAERA